MIDKLEIFDRIPSPVTIDQVNEVAVYARSEAQKQARENNMLGDVEQYIYYMADSLSFFVRTVIT